MAGELVPLVLLPRYTTYAGTGNFTTIGMDVTEYDSAIINMWRGPAVGTGVTFGATFEESTDQDNWTTCGNTTANSDPGASTEAQYKPTLTKRWFRVKVAVAGAGPVVSCWAIGHLVMRET